MANNASESSALSHSLWVSGLWPTTPTDDTRQKTLALLSHIRLSLPADHVKYISHRLMSQGNEHAALLELEIRDDLLYDFCYAFMQHEMFDKLRKLSKWGLLGFQPLEGTELAQHWHKAVFTSNYVDGAQKMETFQLEALRFPSRENIPQWFKVWNFVATTFIEASIIATLDPSDTAICKARTRYLEQLGQTSRVMEIGNSLAARLCLNWAAQQSSGRSDAEINSEARKACNDLLGTIQTVCKRLERAQGQRSSETCDTQLPEAGQITMIQSRELFKELYDLTTKTYMTFSLTEELMRSYQKEMWKNGAVAAAYSCGCALSFRTMLLRSPTWLGMAGLIIPVWKSAWALQESYQAQVKENHCEQLAHLISQTWYQAAEANTYLRWIHTTNDGVTFLEGCERKWEEQLKLKLKQGEEPQHLQEWKHPTFVKIYLKGRLDELKVMSSEIQSKLGIIFP